MSRITTHTFITLDGVIQGPGRSDEDTHGGFTQGGWAVLYNDDVMAAEAGKGIARTEALLFGWRTYEDFFGFWPKQTAPNPFTDVLNGTPRYVASATLEEPLPWENSTLLNGDVVEGVRRLPERPGRDIVILGSGALIRSLMPHNLIDQYTLLIHPLVLGTGQRLFPDGIPARLELVDSVTTTTGVIIATYRPAGGLTSTKVQPLRWAHRSSDSPWRATHARRRGPGERRPSMSMSAPADRLPDVGVT